MKRGLTGQEPGDLEKQRELLLHRQNAGSAAESLMRGELAAAEAGRWYAIAGKILDTNSRRYFEGLATLSSLKASHHNLSAQLTMRSSEQSDGRLTRTDGKTEAPAAVSPNVSQEIALLQKNLDRARGEFDAHRTRYAAFNILSGRFHTLGMSVEGDGYYDKAKMEDASVKGYKFIVEAYEKKLSDLGVQTGVTDKGLDLQDGLSRLERAGSHLEDFNKAYSEAWERALEALECRGKVDRLQVNLLDQVPSEAQKKQLEKNNSDLDAAVEATEKAALSSARSYLDFETKARSAEKIYESIAQSLSNHHEPGIESTVPFENIAETPSVYLIGSNQLKGVEATQPSLAAKDLPSSVRLPEQHKSMDPATDTPDKAALVGDQRLNRFAVGIVVAQTLKVLDREL